MTRTLHTASLAAHAGVLPSQRFAEAKSPAIPHTEPIAQTSVYDFESIAASEPALSGEGGAVYARYGLPNTEALERAIAALEGAEAALATSYGMSAVAASVLALARAGERVVVQRDAYGGTPALLTRDLGRLGIETVAVDAYDAGAVDAVLDGAAVLLVESISNPLLRRVDLPALSERCRARGATLIVDNTFATPLGCRPLEAGADLVVHSVSKFLAGHHDVCTGAVAGAAPLIAEARGVALRFGLTAKPFDAWLAVRGVRTLSLRMERAWQNAAALAARLGEHERVERVHATERCALVSFDVGSRAAADAVVGALQLITLTPSLGGVTTTVSHSASSSHRGLPPDERAAMGIGDGLLRLSIGIEDADDLWQDLRAALD